MKQKKRKLEAADKLARDLALWLLRRLGLRGARAFQQKFLKLADACAADKLTRRAVATLGSYEAARKWLNSPQVGLGGAVPIEYAKTAAGAREVEKRLGRIEHGVYS